MNIIRKNYRIKNIFEILKNENPNPKTELFSVNHFTFAVAVILSAQATDKGVNKATPALFEIVKTPEQMISLGLKKLENYIKTIGLYHNKAKNIIKMSQMLIDYFGGKLPQDKNDLMRLAGIGVKTASVLRNTLWDKNDIAVDTHVFRLAHRLKFVDETVNTAEKVAILLPRIIPKQYQNHAGNWLVLHGRYICVARKPKCENCKISEYCPSKKDSIL